MFLPGTFLGIVEAAVHETHEVIRWPTKIMGPILRGPLYEKSIFTRIYILKNFFAKFTFFYLLGKAK